MCGAASGPGGGACAVSEKIGAYVDGFDLNGEMAKKSLEIALLKGLDSKTKVRQFDPEKLDLKKEYYDGALIRETLMSIEDKEALLQRALGALREATARLPVVLPLHPRGRRMLEAAGLGGNLLALGEPVRPTGGPLAPPADTRAPDCDKAVKTHLPVINTSSRAC